jgi:gas vesicle protein
MGQLQAKVLKINDSIQSELEDLSSQHKISEQIKSRINIIMLSHSGLSNNKIVKQTGHCYEKVKQWRDRWHKDYDKLLSHYEKATTKAEQKRLILSFFSDAKRSGSPSKISYEAVQKIVAIACSHPNDFNLPRSTWNRDLIAQTAINEGVVSSISGSYVSVLLKKTI